MHAGDLHNCGGSWGYRDTFENMTILMSGKSILNHLEGNTNECCLYYD